MHWFGRCFGRCANPDNPVKQHNGYADKHGGRSCEDQDAVNVLDHASFQRGFGEASQSHSLPIQHSNARTAQLPPVAGNGARTSLRMAAACLVQLPHEHARGAKHGAARTGLLLDTSDHDANGGQGEAPQLYVRVVWASNGAVASPIMAPSGAGAHDAVGNQSRTKQLGAGGGSLGPAPPASGVERWQQLLRGLAGADGGFEAALLQAARAARAGAYCAIRHQLDEADCVTHAPQLLRQSCCAQGVGAVPFVEVSAVTLQLDDSRRRRVPGVLVQLLSRPAPVTGASTCSRPQHPDPGAVVAPPSAPVSGVEPLDVSARDLVWPPAHLAHTAVNGGGGAAIASGDGTVLQAAAAISRQGSACRMGSQRGSPLSGQAAGGGGGGAASGGEPRLPSGAAERLLSPSEMAATPVVAARLHAVDAGVPSDAAAGKGLEATAAGVAAEALPASVIVFAYGRGHSLEEVTYLNRRAREYLCLGGAAADDGPTGHGTEPPAGLPARALLAAVLQYEQSYTVRQLHRAADCEQGFTATLRVPAFVDVAALAAAAAATPVGGGGGGDSEWNTDGSASDTGSHHDGGSRAGRGEDDGRFRDDGDGGDGGGGANGALERVVAVVPYQETAGQLTTLRTISDISEEVEEPGVEEPGGGGDGGGASLHGAGGGGGGGGGGGNMGRRSRALETISGGRACSAGLDRSLRPRLSLAERPAGGPGGAAAADTDASVRQRQGQGRRSMGLSPAKLSPTDSLGLEEFRGLSRAVLSLHGDLLRNSSAAVPSLSAAANAITASARNGAASAAASATGFASLRPGADSAGAAAGGAVDCRALRLSPRDVREAVPGWLSGGGSSGGGRGGGGGGRQPPLSWLSGGGSSGGGRSGGSASVRQAAQEGAIGAVGGRRLRSMELGDAAAPAAKSAASLDAGDQELLRRLAAAGPTLLTSSRPGSVVVPSRTSSTLFGPGASTALLHLQQQAQQQTQQQQHLQQQRPQHGNGMALSGAGATSASAAVAAPTAATLLAATAGQPRLKRPNKKPLRRDMTVGMGQLARMASAAAAAATGARAGGGLTAGAPPAAAVNDMVASVGVGGGSGVDGASAHDLTGQDVFVPVFVAGGAGANAGAGATSVPTARTVTQSGTSGSGAANAAPAAGACAAPSSLATDHALRGKPDVAAAGTAAAGAAPAAGGAPLAASTAVAAPPVLPPQPAPASPFALSLLSRAYRTESDAPRTPLRRSPLSMSFSGAGSRDGGGGDGGDGSGGSRSPSLHGRASVGAPALQSRPQVPRQHSWREAGLGRGGSSSVGQLQVHAPLQRTQSAIGRAWAAQRGSSGGGSAGGRSAGGGSGGGAADGSWPPPSQALQAQKADAAAVARGGVAKDQTNAVCLADPAPPFQMQLPLPRSRNGSSLGSGACLVPGSRSGSIDLAARTSGTADWALQPLLQASGSGGDGSMADGGGAGASSGGLAAGTIEDDGWTMAAEPSSRGSEAQAACAGSCGGGGGVNGDGACASPSPPRSQHFLVPGLNSRTSPRSRLSLQSPGNHGSPAQGSGPPAVHPPALPPLAAARLRLLGAGAGGDAGSGNGVGAVNSTQPTPDLPRYHLAARSVPCSLDVAAPGRHAARALDGGFVVRNATSGGNAQPGSGVAVGGGTGGYGRAGGGDGPATLDITFRGAGRSPPMAAGALRSGQLLPPGSSGSTGFVSSAALAAARGSGGPPAGGGGGGSRPASKRINSVRARVHALLDLAEQVELMRSGAGGAAAATGAGALYSGSLAAVAASPPKRFPYAPPAMAAASIASGGSSVAGGGRSTSLWGYPAAAVTAPPSRALPPSSGGGTASALSNIPQQAPGTPPRSAVTDAAAVAAASGSVPGRDGDVSRGGGTPRSTELGSHPPSPPPPTTAIASASSSTMLTFLGGFVPSAAPSVDAAAGGAARASPVDAPSAIMAAAATLTAAPGRDDSGAHPREVYWPVAGALTRSRQPTDDGLLAAAAKVSGGEGGGGDVTGDVAAAAAAAAAFGSSAPLAAGPGTAPPPLPPLATATAGVAWCQLRARACYSVDGRRVLVVTMTDITRPVQARERVAALVEQEHRILEALFPRHVIAYLTAPAANDDEGGDGGDAAAAGGSPLPPGGIAANGGGSIGDGSVGGGGGAADSVVRGQRQLRRLAQQQQAAALRVSSLATSHRMVTILFSDIVGFTAFSRQVAPLTVMRLLNELYKKLDALLDIYKVYKVETIGDCYVVAGGLVRYDEDGLCSVLAEGEVDALHAVRVLAFGQAMLRAARSVLLPTSGQPLQLRLGLHSGPAMSGVVGVKMPRFTVFGETVALAHAMEAAGRPGRMHVSGATRALLGPREAWERTEGVQMEGRGLMDTYLWVEQEEGDEERRQRVMDVYL